MQCSRTLRSEEILNKDIVKYSEYQWLKPGQNEPVFLLCISLELRDFFPWIDPYQISNHPKDLSNKQFYSKVQVLKGTQKSQTVNIMTVWGCFFKGRKKMRKSIVTNTSYCKFFYLYFFDRSSKNRISAKWSFLQYMASCWVTTTWSPLDIVGNTYYF